MIRKARRAGARAFSLALAGLVASSCYTGGEREKAPPFGYAGGRCNVDDLCAEGECYLDQKVCVLPDDPCEGFFCGGSERGECYVQEAGPWPACECYEGYNNEQFPLYCCPDDGSDGLCSGGTGGGDTSGGDGGGDTGDGGGTSGDTGGDTGSADTGGSDTGSGA